MVGSSFRWAAALLGVFGVVALAASGACTSGVTPDCSDAQCTPVVDAAGVDSADSGDDGSTYVPESGAETGAEGGLEAGDMDADGGPTEAASGPDSSDSGGDTGASDAKADGPKDASADG